MDLEDDAVRVQGPQRSRREVVLTILLYAAGWGAVAAAGWGSSHVSGPLHVVLVVLEVLLGLYLLMLGGTVVVSVGVAALVNGLAQRARPGRPPREIPRAWWIVIGYWVLGVAIAGLVAVVGLGVRGSEARWFLGSLVLAGAVVTGVLGRAGLQEKRTAARLPSEHGRHSR